jgi:Ca-activated chloride channel family protein
MTDGKNSSRTAGLIALLLLNGLTWGQKLSGDPKEHRPQSSKGGEVRIPNRSTEPLFRGQQGNQKTEIHFDPATGLVTIKLLVQDPSGYFIPNIRRENFAVYENNVRQQNVTVEVEHAAVTLAVLMEYGGRYAGLNKVTSEEVSRAGRQLLDILGREDKVAVWTYGDKPEQVADFSQGRETLDGLFYRLKAPPVSEANLYDVLVAVLERMRPVTGRKAILLISSGVDTFSKASFDDVLKACGTSGTPVYVIDVGSYLRETGGLYGLSGPIERIDWKRAEHDLAEIAKASGGRVYSGGNTLDLAAKYDDLMENLRLRYVITYKPSTNADLGSPRTVRVELVNPKTGGPLQIVDADGKTIRASVIVQDSYTPKGDQK